MIKAFGLASVACLCLVNCSGGNSDAPASGGGATAAAGATGKAGASSSGGGGSAGAMSGVAGSSSAGSLGTAGSSTGGASTGGESTGGAAGSAGNASSAGSAGTGMGCSGMALCDDFEANAVDATPAGWTLVNPMGCSGQSFSAKVDSTQFHSGSKSVKITGGDSCGVMLVNTDAFAKLTGGEVYGRFYIRMPSAQMFHHTVLMTLGLKAGPYPAGTLAQDQNLQFAAEDISGANALVWQTGDGNILPAKSPAAAATTTFPKADTWTCVEFHVSVSKQAIETWIDGNVVAGMTFIPGTTPANQEVNGQWKPSLLVAPTSFGLDSVLFGDQALVAYYDDAALGTSRIGCK